MSEARPGAVLFSNVSKAEERDVPGSAQLDRWQAKEFRYLR
jgi:hypothetical protein